MAEGVEHRGHGQVSSSRRIGTVDLLKDPGTELVGERGHNAGAVACFTVGRHGAAVRVVG